MYVIFRKHEIRNVKKDKPKRNWPKMQKIINKKKKDVDTFWKRRNCGWTS